jgi:4-amino-4-deoxy-L-arabinose transferase-like glycosyltransferase
MANAALQNLSRRFREPVFLASLALTLIGILAVAFRLSDLAARDLWTDEAWVALAALKATPGQALAAGQSTPPFYLLAVWAAAKLLGGQEWALRSVSFAFGVGTLLVFWLLARRLTSRPVALLALAAVAVSPVMVYYAKELKQYSGDAFFAVLTVYLAERLRAGGGRQGWTTLALAGVIGLGFSHPLVFMLPAVGLVLWLSLPASRRRLAFLGGLWVLAFGVYYFLFFRHDLDHNLVAYWTQDYPDFSGVWPFCHWLGGALYRFFWYFLGEWGVVWGPPLLLAGGWALWRAGCGRVLAYLGLPILLAFGAAVLHRYPFMAHYGGDRLMLFAAPLLYLVVAAGAGLVFFRLWRGRGRWLAAALTVAIVISLHPWDNLKENLHPEMNREEISPLVARLERERQPGDWIYVYYFAQWPFDYYFHGSRKRICIGKSCVETGPELNPKEKPGRLWLIASHIPNLGHMRRFAAKLLGPGWREIACYQSEGAVLFCFYGPSVETANRR